MYKRVKTLGAVVDGTSYHDQTDPRVVSILESARKTGRRICVRYGDVTTGSEWESGVRECGSVGRSTGSIKIPLLIANITSSGGPAILDHAIVRITDPRERRDLYRHPKYHSPERQELLVLLDWAMQNSNTEPDKVKTMARIIQRDAGQPRSLTHKHYALLAQLRKERGD